MKTGLFSTFRRRSTRARQRGVSIISAIFLLLLFAALATFMVSLTGTANITSAQDVQGSRAYQSAQAGLEWGLYQVLTPATASCAASTTLPSLVEGFSVTVACAMDGPYTEAGQVFSLYRLVSTAKTPGAAPGSIAFVERQVAASVSR